MIITTSEEVDNVGKVEAVEYVELLVEGVLEVLPGRRSLRAATEESTGNQGRDGIT